MNGHTQFLQLGEGGRVAFQEYGDASGVPVLFCHGWPSSRTMAQLTHDAARQAGVRIISPDRPGLGDSSFKSGRKLSDWPRIVLQLMQQLSVDKYRILGISGGAPYAYVTAWSMPEKVQAIAVVSGAPPIAELDDHRGLFKIYRWMLFLRRTRPRLLRRLFRIARPFASVRPPIRFRPLLLRLLQPCDANVLRDSTAFEVCFESSRRAWRGSLEGVTTDAEVYAEPWGFSPEEITVPIRLWHGTADRAFSFRLIEHLATRLQNCHIRIVEGAGHFSLPIRHMEEILRDLKSV